MTEHPERRQQERRRTRLLDFLFTQQAFGRRRGERRESPPSTPQAQ